MQLPVSSLSKRSYKLFGALTVSILTLAFYFALRLTVMHFRGGFDSCGPLGDCNAVLHSAAATVGRIPTATFGAVAAGLLLLCVLGQELSPRWMSRIFWAIAIPSLTISFCLQLYAAFAVHALCPLCLSFFLALAVSTLCHFIAQRYGPSDKENTSSGGIKFGAFFCMAGLLMVLYGFFPVSSRRAGISHPEALAAMSDDLLFGTAITVHPEGARKAIAFADPECLVCADELPKVLAALAHAPDVALSIHWLPKSNGGRKICAVLLACGNKNDPSKLLTDLYANIPESDQQIEKFGIGHGLTANEVAAAMFSQSDMQRRVKADLELAKEVGVQGVPVFIVPMRGEPPAVLDPKQAVKWIRDPS